MILLPPADPVAIVTSPVFRSSAILLEIEDCGLLPGAIKLDGEGLKPKALVWPGDYG